MNPQPDLLKQPPPPLPVRAIKLPTAAETILPNGLTVVVVEDTRLPLVSYRLALRTGDAHDPADLPGLMDMLTGLLTEGTESRTSREIADEVARLGATLQAGANSDYATVAASSLAVFCDEILELLADVALRPIFPPNEVELAKQNTKESLKQQRAQPSFLASEMVARVMFGAHPYHVTAPTPESIDATTRDRLVDFHRATFIPNNAVLFVAGDVQQDTVLRQVENLFGSWQPGTVIADDFPPAPERSARVAYIVDRPGSAQANIVISNSGITRTSSDYFPMLLMHTVLGANASSRLFMNLREDKGYTYGAYSNFASSKYRGTWSSSSEVRTEVTDGAMKEFKYELERLGKEKVSSDELENAKRAIIGGFALSLEQPAALLQNIITQKLYNLPADYWDTYPQKVSAITADDVQRVAQKYIDLKHLQVVAVGDASKTKDILSHYGTVQVYDAEGKPVGSGSENR